MTISPWHGVTTVAMGNCGFGVAPTRPEHRGLIMRTLEKVEGMSIDALEAGLGYDWPFETFPEYLDAIEKRGTAINTAALVGHTPVRLYVMGEEATERTATPDEIARMHDIVRAAIDAGAIGFATSKSATHVGFMGKPVPSRAATIEEIKTLAASLGEAGKGVMQATIGKDLYLKEFKEIAQTTGRTVTWTALLAGARGNGWEQEQLVRSAELVREGLRVVPQVIRVRSISNSSSRRPSCSRTCRCSAPSRRRISTARCASTPTRRFATRLRPRPPDRPSPGAGPPPPSRTVRRTRRSRSAPWPKSQRIAA